MFRKNTLVLLIDLANTNLGVFLKIPKGVVKVKKQMPDFQIIIFYIFNVLQNISEKSGTKIISINLSNN